MPSLLQSPKCLLAILILLGGLAGSIAGNLFLFAKAKDFYAREAQVRMEPISDRFAKSNAKLLEQPKTKPRMIIFGESRCSMWGGHHPTTWGDIEIVNRGIGGETTPQIMRRLESDVLALDPDIVLLQMGDNDLKTMAVLPGTREKTIERTYYNIAAIAKRLSDEGVEVIITTIFPTGQIELLRKPFWSDEVNESIDLVNERLLAIDYPNTLPVDCDAILRDGRFIRKEYSLDTLHLTPAGYAALNSGLEPIVSPIVERISSNWQ